MHCNDMIMGDNNELNLVGLLEKGWFSTLLGPCLSFADLRNLSSSNKTTQAAVQELVRRWPDEIRELLGTWCGETPSSLLIFGIHGDSCENGVDTLRGAGRPVWRRNMHPAPIARCLPDSLAYNN